MNIQKPLIIAGTVLAITAFPTLQALGAPAAAGKPNCISVETASMAWSIHKGNGGRLYQAGLGPRSTAVESDPKKLCVRVNEIYPQWGAGYIWEPALQATHADGNTSTDLIVVGQETKTVGEGVVQTRIQLKDTAYPFFVTLCFKAYPAFDVIEQWTEIRHEESGPVQLDRFASSSPLFNTNLFLTQYIGDWANEMNPTTERLNPGIKVVDSKIIARAHQFRNPSFLLSDREIVQEDAGTVWAGALAWPGSFQFAFENVNNRVRALCGINPFASQIHLEPGRVFTTPSMVWAYSGNGLGPLSRNLHRWARRHALRDGDKPRAVILNNWEATHFAFDEKKLVSLFDRAKDVGCDLFLLDDGWFGKKYARNGDNAGLGDWMADPVKLPRGLGYLCEQAKARGLRFGIWLEPEMVNPSSELFEAHPDWAIQQPRRGVHLMRKQLVLDLSRPDVKDYVFKCVDRILAENPGISYVKWDANRYVTQPGSAWLKPGFQSHLGIDYNNALLDIMGQVAERHPEVEMMVCAGGGGRVDFGSMRYFHEFWPSDKTDPLRRVSMQWDYSTCFPAIAISGHVTSMGRRSLKFAFDVAMSVRLGLDMDLNKLSPADQAFVASAIKTYKERLRTLVQFGELYRIENPHSGPRAVLNYVSQDRSRAALFIFQTQDASAMVAKPAGLDPAKRYRVCEINLREGEASKVPQHGKVIDGATLMEAGVLPSCAKSCESAVIEMEALCMSLSGGEAEPSMTYTEANWKTFVESHKGNRLMKFETLCRTDKGRAVELLRINSKRNGYGSYPILLTARHDARDAVANYVLEGILETLLGDTEDAKWLRDRSEIVAIPFVDKDGVEDGAPGKDYACDYGAESKLASVEAITKFMKATWSEYYPTSIIDLHAAAPQSKVKGAAWVGGPGLWNWQQTLRFAGTLKGLGNALNCEAVENAKLDSSSLTPLSTSLCPPGPDTTKSASSESSGKRLEFRDWLTQMTSVRFAARLEVSSGITPDLARAFGRDLVKALRRDLQGDASVFTDAFSERANMKYKISLPKGYDKDPAKKWPMILWLHGAGPCYNYEDVTTLGVPRYVLDHPDCPFITLTPLLAVTSWSACSETLDILLQETMARYRVDAQRVYMTGQSAGANGTWDMAMFHPERFAAIAPVSHYTVQPPERFRNLAGLPIWVIYGDQDKMVSLQPLQKIVDTIRGLGIPVRFSILPGVTHDTFRDAFLKPELYDWFLQHTNSGIKPVKPDIKGVSLVTVPSMRVASCKRSVGWATLQRFVTENQISNPRYFWSRERGALYVTIGDASVKETDTIKITEIFGGKHAMRELPPTSRSFWEAYVDVVDVYRWMTLHDLQFDAVHCYFETDGTSPNPPNTKVYIAVKENKK